jgi:hypothetical protein
MICGDRASDRYRALPVYIMNGEYDPSTGFKEGEELAAKISGAYGFPCLASGISHVEDYPR